MGEVCKKDVPVQVKQIMRRAEKKQGDAWVSVEFKDLKKGDMFRTFEGDNGEQTVALDGSKEFTAECDAYMDDKSGLHVVKIEVAG